MNPIVLVMLDAPVPEWLATGLVRDFGEEFAVRISRLVAELQISRIPHDWQSRILVAPEEQVGAVQGWKSSFGKPVLPQKSAGFCDRILAACEDAAATHSGLLILVRADCPYLDEEVFRAAKAALETADCVIGPSTDGDFYLLGFRSAPVGILEEVEWGTNQVFFAIERRARAAGLETTLLEPLERVIDGATWGRAVERIVPPEMRGG